MSVRFYSGAWRDDDGNPISTEGMQTAGEPGKSEEQETAELVEDIRKPAVKKDPRKNRPRQ